MKMVEALTPATVEDALPVMRALFAEGRVPGRLDEKFWTAHWRGLLENNDGQLFVTRHDGQVVSLLAAASYRDPATAQRCATLVHGFVLRGFRTGRMHDSIKTFVHWARVRGCVRVFAGYLESPELEQMARIYKKFGFFPLERTYLKVLCQ